MSGNLVTQTEMNNCEHSSLVVSNRIRSGLFAWSRFASLTALIFPLVCGSQEHPDVRPWAPGERDAATQFAELKNASRFAESIPPAESWVQIAESHHGPDHTLTRPALESLAMAYLMAKRFPEAETLYRRALEMAERDAGPFHNETERILRRMTFLYEATGKSAEVRDLRSRQQAAASTGLTSAETGQTLLDQGRRYYRMGRYAEAENLFKGALESVEKELGPGHAKAALSLYELASLYHLLKRYAEAEQAALRSLEVAERTRGPRSEFTLNLMTVLSNIYLFTRRPEESAKVRERQIQLRMDDLSEHKENLAILEIILGAAHPTYSMELGQTVSAAYFLGTGSAAQSAAFPGLLQTLERIRPLVEQELGPNHFQVAEILKHTGSILLRQDRFGEAEPIYLRRLEILEGLTGRSMELRTHLADTFKFYHEWNEPEKSRPFCQRLLDRERKVLESALRTTAEANLLSSSLGLYSYAAPTLGDGSLSADAILLYKGIVSEELLERRRALMNASQAALDPRVARFQALRQELMTSQLEGMIKGANLDKIGDIEKELQSVEHELIKDGSLAPPSLRSLSIRHSDVAAVLPPNMAVIDYFRFSRYLGNNGWGPSYGCSIIRKDRPPVFELCGRAESTDKAIFEFREMVARVASGVVDDAALEAASRKLHELLIAKLLPHLDGVETLVIAPDKALNLLPFPALQDAQGRFLAESFLVYHVSSGRDLIPRSRPADEPGPAVVLADPQFSLTTAPDGLGAAPAVHRAFAPFDLPPLPGTRTEARGVYGILNGTPQIPEYALPLAGAQASETALRGVKSPRILHLATHGFFLSDLKAPESSPETGGASVSSMDLSFGGALALTGADDTLRRWGRGDIPDPASDGILFTGEIPGLDLRGTELVVLSACRTALGAGSGEGVNGMRRAFVTAGARNVLMTLWDIADEPTAEFMTQFYQRFKESGNAPHSLAGVQRESLVRLRDKEGLSVAVYLAGPFVLSAQAIK
ncbi:MAG: CHAT domain-containing protein [Verrucomicrobiales bacterium]|nr:CHAT domain-containing protein [Verrucomicrobiales bacterium]